MHAYWIIQQIPQECYLVRDIVRITMGYAKPILMTKMWFGQDFKILDPTSTLAHHSYTKIFIVAFKEAKKLIFGFKVEGVRGTSMLKLIGTRKYWLIHSSLLSVSYFKKIFVKTLSLWIEMTNKLYIFKACKWTKHLK